MSSEKRAKNSAVKLAPAPDEPSFGLTGVKFTAQNWVAVGASDALNHNFTHAFSLRKTKFPARNGPRIRQRNFDLPRGETSFDLCVHVRLQP